MFESCSRSCGTGITFRTRTCLRGYDCPGPGSNSKTCNTYPCSSKIQFSINPYFLWIKGSGQVKKEALYVSHFGWECSIISLVYLYLL